MSEIVTQTKQQSDEHWFKQHWRPAMAWVYMVICVFDFIIAPIITIAFFYVTQSNIVVQPNVAPEVAQAVLASRTTLVHWTPLTLQSGGFFHITMGAILGISSWTRGQEKIERTKST